VYSSQWYILLYYHKEREEACFHQFLSQPDVQNKVSKENKHERIKRKQLAELEPQDETNQDYKDSD
jgi:hypothetical protein